MVVAIELTPSRSNPAGWWPFSYSFLHQEKLWEVHLDLKCEEPLFLMLRVYLNSTCFSFLLFMLTLGSLGPFFADFYLGGRISSSKYF